MLAAYSQSSVLWQQCPSPSPSPSPDSDRAGDGPACLSLAQSLATASVLRALLISSRQNSSLFPSRIGRQVSVRRQCDALVLIPPPNPTLIYFYGVLAHTPSKGKALSNKPRAHSAAQQLSC
ncbi:hypothetical protein V8C35DRAFT_298502 [Trichoderma chlorosporum]